MSLILEALKKSEQQRRLGEAPNLGTPVLTTRRRRSVLPVLALLIVLALGAGWWVLRTRSAATPAGGTNAVAVAPAEAPAAAPGPAGGKAAPPRATPATPRRAASGNDRKPANHPGEAAGSPPLPVTPKPSDRPGAVVPLPPANPLTGGPRNAAPAATPAPTARPQPARVTPAAPGSMAVTPPSAPPLPSRPPAPAKPALPSVWELPYATRKDLPDLHLTMHVYAAAPSERFVVIAGERHVEGDDLGDGVILREIRPEGLVLDLKGKQFLYPRDGR